MMLVSANVDSTSLFSNLRLVIVDEIHAFAGDDRGWHLLSVLERISRIAGREIQRIGLSATVGNPEVLLDWIAGSCRGPRRVFRPEASAASQAEVMLDYVGSLENAAVVISRLHRGEKRLVFVDSRAKAEKLGAKPAPTGRDDVRHAQFAQPGATAASRARIRRTRKLCHRCDQRT